LLIRAHSLVPAISSQERWAVTGYLAESRHYPLKRLN